MFNTMLNYLFQKYRYLNVSHQIIIETNVQKNMLEQKYKLDIQAMTDKYDFSHLRPSSDVYSITLAEQDKWLISKSEDRRRKIFWNIQYTSYQQEALAQIKSQLIENDVFQKFSDAIILKHWYAAGEDVQKTITRLQALQGILNDPVITKFTKTTQEFLKKGLIYTYGYDKKFKPVVITQNKKINYELSQQQNLNIQYFFLLLLHGFKFTPGYAERFILISDLKDVEISDIPTFYVYRLMKKFSVITCDLAEKIFIVNSQRLATVWNIINGLIPEDTRKKIEFIKKGQQYKILQYINPDQLQRKYGGNLPNLTEYFPPTCPQQNILQYKNEQLSETVYDSIMNDSRVFLEQQMKENLCCGNQSCQIF